MRSLLSSQRSRLRPYTKAWTERWTHLSHLDTTSMSPIISEILKIKANSTFTLDCPAFSSLREIPIKFGVKEQYYGRCTDEPDTLIWVVRASDPSYPTTPLHLLIFLLIDWPKDVNPMDHTRNDMQAFRKSVREMDVNSDPSSWYLPFDSADLVRPALTASVCQLVR